MYSLWTNSLWINCPCSIPATTTLTRYLSFSIPFTSSFSIHKIIGTLWFYPLKSHHKKKKKNVSIDTDLKRNLLRRNSLWGETADSPRFGLAGFTLPLKIKTRESTGSPHCYTPFHPFSRLKFNYQRKMSLCKSNTCEHRIFWCV